MSRLDDRAQVVYRLFDSSGVLLYVGMTVDWHQRRRQHRGDKAWWAEVDESRTTFEHHHTRECCQLAEATAIYSESPRHNAPTWRPKGYMSSDQQRRLSRLRDEQEAAEADYRAAVVQALEDGASFLRMAEFTGHSTNTLQAWKRAAGA